MTVGVPKFVVRIDISIHINSNDIRFHLVDCNAFDHGFSIILVIVTEIIHECHHRVIAISSVVIAIHNKRLEFKNKPEHSSLWVPTKLS